MKVRALVFATAFLLSNTEAYALGWEDLVEAGCGALFVGVEFAASNPEGKAMKEAGKEALIGFVGDLGCGAVGGLLDDKPVDMEDVKREISAQIDENTFNMYKKRFQDEVDGYELLLQDDREYAYGPLTLWEHLSEIDTDLRKHIPALERQARQDATSIWIYAALARLHLAVLNQLAIYAATDPNLGAERHPDAWVQTWATYQLRYALYLDLVANEVFSQESQKAEFLNKKKALADDAPFQCVPAKDDNDPYHTYFAADDNFRGYAMDGRWEVIDNSWRGGHTVGWQPRGAFFESRNDFNNITGQLNWLRGVETYNMVAGRTYFKWIDEVDHKELSKEDIVGKDWFKYPWTWVHPKDDNYFSVFFVPGEEMSHREISINNETQKVLFHLPEYCLSAL